MYLTSRIGKANEARPDGSGPPPEPLAVVAAFDAREWWQEDGPPPRPAGWLYLLTRLAAPGRARRTWRIRR